MTTSETILTRANELLAEARRYRTDSEAIRLQLASTAKTVERRFDELPSVVREVVHAVIAAEVREVAVTAFSSLQPTLKAAERVGHRFKMVERSLSLRAGVLMSMLLVASVVAAAGCWWWVAEQKSELARMREEVAQLNQRAERLAASGAAVELKKCQDPAGRERLCVKVDESWGRLQGSYYPLPK